MKPGAAGRHVAVRRDVAARLLVLEAAVAAKRFAALFTGVEVYFARAAFGDAVAAAPGIGDHCGARLLHQVRLYVVGIALRGHQLEASCARGGLAGAADVADGRVDSPAARALLDPVRGRLRCGRRPDPGRVVGRGGGAVCCWRWGVLARDGDLSLALLLFSAWRGRPVKGGGSRSLPLDGAGGRGRGVDGGERHVFPLCLSAGKYVKPERGLFSTGDVRRVEELRRTESVDVRMNDVMYVWMMV